MSAIFDNSLSGVRRRLMKSLKPVPVVADAADVVKGIREHAEIIRAMPPTPRAILTNHAVPFGRSFRQWDTNGVLWAWANPGEIAAIPRSGPRDVSLVGIPVYRS